MTTDSKTLGKILKQRRLAVPMTLGELAAASGVSPSHLDRIERGERFPSGHILRKIARPLGFDENELFTLAGYLTPQAEAMPGTAQAGVRTGKLDPYVASVLAQEPVEIQRALLGIFSTLKVIARSLEKERVEEALRPDESVRVGAEGQPTPREERPSGVSG